MAEKRALQPTGAMHLLCAPNNIDELWHGLIVSRMEELVRPNLDIIFLPKLADQKLIWSNHGEVALRLGCDDKIVICHMATLDQRGIFQIFARPVDQKKPRRQLQAWGFDFNGAWRHVAITVGPRMALGDDWVETVLDLKVSAVTLQDLLSTMDVAREDPDDVWALNKNPSPAVIWNRIGSFIAEWHTSQAARFERSQRFDALRETEDCMLMVRLNSLT